MKSGELHYDYVMLEGVIEEWKKQEMEKMKMGVVRRGAFRN
jgi:hypothetical protein